MRNFGPRGATGTSLPCNSDGGQLQKFYGLERVLDCRRKAVRRPTKRVAQRLPVKASARIVLAAGSDVFVACNVLHRVLPDDRGARYFGRGRRR